jgi:hypothetical protein
MKESELEKFVSEIAEFIAQNAMNDYKRRADSAAKERRFACMDGEIRGDSYIVIAKKLVEIDKKHGII